MRVRILILVVIMIVGGYALVRVRSASHTAALPLVESVSAGAVPPKVDFTTEVRPILARCQPCHFSGGKMYEELPFDRAETVTKLGEKLFTRIKSDNERKIIREFLSQNQSR